MKALEAHGVDGTYVEVLANMYNTCTAQVRIQRDSSEKFRILRGVRQGDTLSPKMFSAALEEVFRRVNLEGKGININGEYLSHLRFADDIVLISHSASELENMIEALHAESLKIGLKMNMKKTKVMFNSHIVEGNIRMAGQTIEIVNEYTYLGQLITMSSDRTDEISRRIAAGWGAYTKYREIMKSKMPICLKRRVYNQCIQPAMVYGCQTWATTKKLLDRLRVTQRSMERSMIGVSKRDHMTNKWIRQVSGVQDIVEHIKKQKWRWSGHIARMQDNRWTKLATEWIPRGTKRLRARPKTRWEDDIMKMLGVTWGRVARDRQVWKSYEKAFIQQWIDSG
jgi:hypothetical protein